MPIEATVNTISDLDPTYPLGTDSGTQGDNHIRNIKTAVKNTFPNVVAAVTADSNELNKLDGLTATKDELNALANGSFTKYQNPRLTSLNNALIAPSDWNAINSTGFYMGNPVESLGLPAKVAGSTATEWTSVVHVNTDAGSGTTATDNAVQIGKSVENAYPMFFRTKDEGVWGPVRIVLDDSMYGHGKGINADMVDGLHASNLVRSDVVSPFTYNTVQIRVDGNKHFLFENAAGTNEAFVAYDPGAGQVVVWSQNGASLKLGGNHAKWKDQILATRGDALFHTTAADFNSQGSIIVGHKMGERPSRVEVSYVCKAAHRGFSVGDELPMYGMNKDENSDMVYYDTENVYWYKRGGDRKVRAPNGDIITIWSSNWNMRFRAWY